MATQKCINDYGVDEVIFEEGCGRNPSVVLDGLLDRRGRPACKIMQSVHDVEVDDG